MAEGTGERVLQGLSATDGLAIGQVFLQRTVNLSARTAGAPTEERQALDTALAVTRREIEALAAGADELAGEILEFQSALLEDDDLLGGIFDKILAGQGAHEAWADVIDTEAAEYRSGDDEYFAARAEDLIDLKTRVLKHLCGGGPGIVPQVAPDAILVADELTPSRFLELDWSSLRGAAIRGGSPTSHVAILARARGVPLIVGINSDLDDRIDGAPAVLDAKAGRLVVGPDAGTLSRARSALRTMNADRLAAQNLIDRPAHLPNGEHVRVLINADDPAVLESIAPEHCDGIGLTRTEFLFEDGHLPDEDAQFGVYRRLVNWAAGRPVTVRTLDAGGDKPISGVTPTGESNPFLGLRGLRLSLQKPEILSVQLRALARAAALGPLKIMVPMVTVPDEMVQVRALLDAAIAALTRQGMPHARPDLGMMIEVPAAALMADRFDADFYSIGSNDLIQYLTASARDNAAVAPLADPRNPAVIESIRRVVAAGRARGAEVSLCGDMASSPDLVPLLLDCGLRTLSVAPAQIGPVKLAIQRYRGPTQEHE